MHTFFIISSCIFILIGVFGVIGGILNGRGSSIIIGLCCVVIWAFILYDEVRNKPKTESQTIEMKVESRYYINKNDTFLVSSDTIYPI